MINKAKDINNHKYYFFDDIINIKFFDPNNVRTDENPQICEYIEYVTI